MSTLLTWSLSWATGAFCASPGHSVANQQARYLSEAFETPHCTGLVLALPEIPGTSVVAVDSSEVHGYPLSDNKTIDFCDVNVTLTHGDTGDRVRVEVWLPLGPNTWNGRFQGTGGGGFIAGRFAPSLSIALGDGYAAASTDAGLSKADGSELVNNNQLMLNFASLSVHELAVVGKAAVKSFYGKAPKSSYWNGCSTGGRQGMMEAQRYPEDFDGILAIAPAINWDRFIPAELYPYVVMKEEGEFVSPCVFDSLINYAITACDQQDGVKDDIATDPLACKFDARSVVGQPTNCNVSSEAAITARQAEIYNLILQGYTSREGERRWYGLLPGAPTSGLAQASPFYIAETWAYDFVLQQPERNISTITYEALDEIFDRSRRWNSVIGTDDPDLSRFRDRGGKVLTWHGLADQLIFPEGTFDYFQRVDALLGENSAVSEFYRVFGAPGVEHCAGGNGPFPYTALDQLVEWVEDGKAPDTLRAETIVGQNIARTLDLCLHPLKLKYDGAGDINDANNWTCT